MSVYVIMASWVNVHNVAMTHDHCHISKKECQHNIVLSPIRLYEEWDMIEYQKN